MRLPRNGTARDMSTGSLYSPWFRLDLPHKIHGSPAAYGSGGPGLTQAVSEQRLAEAATHTLPLWTCPAGLSQRS